VIDRRKVAKRSRHYDDTRSTRAGRVLGVAASQKYVDAKAVAGKVFIAIGFPGGQVKLHACAMSRGARKSASSVEALLR